jgi:hypothetical protein
MLVAAPPVASGNRQPTPVALQALNAVDFEQMRIQNLQQMQVSCRPQRPACRARSSRVPWWRKPQTLPAGVVIGASCSAGASAIALPCCIQVIDTKNRELLALKSGATKAVQVGAGIAGSHSLSHSPDDVCGSGI